MDTPNHAGNGVTPIERLCYPDLSGREITAICARLDLDITNIETKRLNRLLETLSQGNRALADKVLRSWGIRR